MNRKGGHRAARAAKKPKVENKSPLSSAID